MGNALLGPSGVLTAQENALKSLPPQFSTDSLIEEQYEATSKDGTKVPYFIVYKDSDGMSPFYFSPISLCLLI